MRWLVLTCCLVVLIPVAMATDMLATPLNPAVDTSNVMDEVVVTGEWAGPQLWKVTKGDHVVWILGTLQPLPKKMIWKSNEVEQIIAHSQQVIGKTNVRPKVSIFGLLPLYLQFKKLSKLPDKQTLKDVLPDDLYQRYLAIVQRHGIHDSDLESLRPIVAAGQLHRDVIEASGLTGKNDIQAIVLKLADRYDVAVRDLTIKVEEPREVLKQVSQVPRADEIACFAEVVSGLETELPMLQQRASAWARGDVNGLRKLVGSESHTVCRDALLNVSRVKEVSDHAKASWVAAIGDALTHYQSAVAMSPVYDLIGKEGGLDQLRAAGYQVEGP